MAEIERFECCEKCREFSESFASAVFSFGLLECTYAGLLQMYIMYIEEITFIAFFSSSSQFYILYIAIAFPHERSGGEKLLGEGEGVGGGVVVGGDLVLVWNLPEYCFFFEKRLSEWV